MKLKIPFKRKPKNTVAENDLNAAQKEQIALDYLVSPKVERLTKKEKKKSDQVLIITKELNRIRLFYRSYPKEFSFRGKTYPILPAGIIPLKTQWRKKQTGQRLYIQPEDMIGPAYPNGQEVLTDIPWFDPKTKEPIREKVIAIVEKDETGKEIKREMEKIKVKTSKEVFDWFQATLNEIYTERVYGGIEEKPYMTAVLAMWAMGATVAAIILGVLAAHAGVL